MLPYDKSGVKSELEGNGCSQRQNGGKCRDGGGASPAAVGRITVYSGKGRGRKEGRKARSS